MYGIWRWGGRETSNPKCGHTYTQGGDYMVKLTLINPSMTLCRY